MSDSIRARFNLTGKVAIVTGASKGIGESIARGLAEFGAKVMVSSRKQEAVDAVAKGIQAAGGEADALAAHAGSISDLHALVDKTVSRFGGVDIIVNNAAANPVFGPIVTADEGVFDKIMAVNVKGPLELGKRAFPIMAERGGGSVINISSIGGISPEPMLGIYSVSKSALISLTKVLAAEWGAAKIRVNAICPGLVQTKFSKALWEDPRNLQKFVEQLPLERMAQPEEIAPLAIFLAGDAASYCTGGVYVVDGGHTI
ncbi:MAG TPA: glucose 1-dehydrogenase [Pirellulales bacterium]|jgi:NAD(P)-dependent dehydrogenase (short-subunit alcohol dehydrogenase family)